MRKTKRTERFDRFRPGQRPTEVYYPVIDPALKENPLWKKGGLG